MVKKAPKQTRIEELGARLQTLTNQRLKAYRAGASWAIIDQIDRMIEETTLDLYTETEIKQHRDSNDEDGESFIV